MSQKSQSKVMTTKEAISRKDGDSLINQAFKTDDGLKAYFDEWIYGQPDRNAYMKHHVEVFGQQMLNRYQARSCHSAPANYGIPFQSGWDINGFSNDLGVDMQGPEKLIEEKSSWRSCPTVLPPAI